MAGDSRGLIVVVATGLLALLGTIAGGLVDGYWKKEIAEQKFQSDLILRALQPEEPDDRLQSIEFLVEAGLIRDTQMSNQLRSMLASNDIKLPRFAPPQAVQGASAKAEAGLEDSKADGTFHALSGLVVHHGDIIDAVTPMFSEVLVNGDLGEEEKLGLRYGEAQGAGTRLQQPGHIITEVRMIRGLYFGASHVIHISVVWRKLTRDGLDSANEITSVQLGGGNYSENQHEVSYIAPVGHYISDLLVPDSIAHSSGDVYLNDLIAEFAPLPTSLR